MDNNVLSNFTGNVQTFFFADPAFTGKQGRPTYEMIKDIKIKAESKC